MSANRSLELPASIYEQPRPKFHPAMGLVDAADGGAILLPRSTGAVIAQYRNCAIGRLLCGGADNYYRAALFDVIGVKFLIADIVRLFTGLVARFSLFEMAAGAEQPLNPVG